MANTGDWDVTALASSSAFSFRHGPRQHPLFCRDSPTRGISPKTPRRSTENLSRTAVTSERESVQIPPCKLNIAAGATTMWTHPAIHSTRHTFVLLRPICKDDPKTSIHRPRLQELSSVKVRDDLINTHVYARAEPTGHHPCPT